MLSPGVRVFALLVGRGVHSNVCASCRRGHYTPMASGEVGALPHHGKNIQATCVLLRTLLTEDPNYRRQWRACSERTSRVLNQSAVAKVIQFHLWESGECSDGDVTIARMLKDRVSRALAGKVLSSETLNWIVCAFDMTISDKERLWELFSGNGKSGSEISHTLKRRREMLRRQCHRTVNLVERYVVDEAGYLTLRRTAHTIRAVEDGVDRYIFNHEPEVADVEVVFGGELGKRYEYGGGLCSVEINLDRPLAKGDTVGLEYLATFEHVESRLTEVRRAAFARVENVDLAVTFLRAPPRWASWCVWDDQIEGEPLEERRIDVINGSIRQFVESIEETVVGFRWHW